MRCATLTVLFAAACTSKGDTGTPPEVTITDDTAESCSGHAPVIGDAWCENTGLDTYEGTGEVPTMTIWAQVADEDGDLDRFGVEVAFDSTVDGAMGDDATRLDRVEGTLDAPHCSATGAKLGLKLYLAGGEPAVATQYEFGIAVLDAAGMKSDEVVTTCWTPDENGNTVGGDTGGGDTGT